MKLNKLLPKKSSKFNGGYLLVGGLIIVTFIFGIGVGNGAISFDNGSYKDSIQKNNQDLSFEGLQGLYDSLRESYDGQLDVGKLEQGMREGLVKAAGDPHTEYLSQEQYDQFNSDLNGEFQGIGAELSKDDRSIVVISPIAGFPAEKAGIKAKDVISKINGESAYDLSVSEAVSKIRGEKGTTVKLEVIRGGELLNFEITRDQISIPSVKWEVTPDKIGILTISRFSDDTAELSRKAAKEFKDQQIKGVVLDMRGNSGGLLNASVDVSNLWLEQGKTILEEKRNNVVIKTYKASGSALLKGMPTVVLIDAGSASASEITAGALKDNGAASIVGERSFGKGSVQELQELKTGGVLKVTIAHWFTPSGRNIDKEGIEPDQKVELKTEDIAAGRDPQKDAALQKLK